MKIFSNDSLDPSRTVEVRLAIVDATGDPVVWSAQFGVEEPVFFECPSDSDSLEIVDQAFAARRGHGSEVSKH